MAACDSVDAAKPFDYEAMAELFPTETENSIINSRDTDDLTAPQKRSDLQSKNCRHSCSKGPTSKSRRSGSTAMNSNEMRRLYDSAEFPLARRAAA